MAFPREHGAARATPLQLLALLAVTAFAYGEVGDLGFVWDDVPLVVRNRLTGDLSNLPRFFRMDLWDGSPVEEGVSGYYRPLMLASLALDRAAWGLSPAGHHLHGLVWHLCAVAALYGLVGRLVGAGGALLAAALFALHPIQSEAVIWVSARNDPMAAALGFAALGQVVGRRETPGRLVVAGVLVFLAGLAKEWVLVVPLLLLAVDLGSGRRPTVRRYLPFLGGVCAAAVLRATAEVGAATWPDAEGWSLLARRAPHLAGVLGAGVVEPWPQSTGRSLEWLDREPAWRVGLGLVALAAWLVACVRSNSRGERLPLAGLAWSVLALVPIVVPIADKGMVGERYLYFAMAGVGLSAAAFAGRRGTWMAAALALPCVWLVRHRVPEWRSDLTLWAAAVEATPNPLTRTSVGHAWNGEGKPELALPAFVLAVDDPIPDRSACPRMVGAALAVGRPALAAQLGRWGASGRCEEDGVFVGQYAVALAVNGRWDEVGRLAGRSTAADPEGRLPIALAAWYRATGEGARFDAMMAARAGDPRFAEEVAKVLRAAAGPPSGVGGEGAGGPPARE